MNDLLPGLKLPLSVERQVLFWFEPLAQPAIFAPEHCPIFIWENEPHRFFYGFPNLGDGIKIGIHHQGEVTSPERVNRDVAESEIEGARNLLGRARI